ncbi:MAG: trypsin-like peptidase domain-containing protein [Flavobacteriales bacterium]|jgi:lysyl endopeptidase|nr:trypsin-like peptidase domain-containing protein [Flavobacteriales bacterium]MBK7268888.1 trypsin-like peptidase domain-containing protein [Flavobacteriales bacterium]MBK7752196.1 trypsin-like peptidase domain-containing protein [Flavobacteriales bacterium]MBK9074320.1 trypsin-like peptidase domain-containing protein [Flavobacteriales bacterium]
MNVLYSALSVATVITALSPAFAQLDPAGEPLGYHRIDHGLPHAPVRVMPPVDVPALMAEDEARIAAGIKGPWRFGFDHATDLSMENSGVWSVLSNGDRVWQLGIECPGAYSINFEFHTYQVPEGARVFVYNTMSEHYGPYTAATNGGRPSMGVGQLGGDRITIEYYEPAALAGAGALRIGQVTHAYRDVLGLTKGLNDSGPCNNNVICPEGDPWRDQIRSVAMITAGGGLCTGQLVNNCAQDSTPYFLTANHCVNGGSVSNWVFRFRWESPTCTPTANTTGLPKNVNGSTLLVTNPGSDMALLELNSRPQTGWNTFYTGWDKSTTAATSVTAIHHPAGDIKKISFEEQPVSSQNYGGAQCWRVAAWDDGTTEGGSSGSGLWNQNGLLVGQLFGGQANCTTNINDYYGKFNVSYPFLQQYLGNCGNTLEGLNYVAAGMADRVGSPNAFTIFPNPTAGAFTISWAGTVQGAAALMVLDPVGRVVVSRSTSAVGERFVLDLSDQADGLYLIELRQGQQRSVQRLVLQR